MYTRIAHMAIKGLIPPSISNIPENPDILVTIASQYREAIANTCMNRAVFITGSGHFGLGPYFAAQNDVVSVLYGSRFPVVLRPIGEDFIFLGTCYVDGIMHGEASNSDDEDEVTFSLR